MTDKEAHYTEIGRAIERAAEVLPEGYSLIIDVERGAGVVSIDSNSADTLDCDFYGDTFADRINAAIDFSIDHAREHGHVQ